MLPAIVPFIPAIAQGVMGLGQTIFGALGAGKARREAERAVNAMRPDQGIMDYYNKALARYNPNAYQSTYYQQMQNQINRGLATGLGASQTRRGGLMALPGLVQGSMDQQARAAAQAEQIAGQDLSRLAGAAQMSAADRRRVEEAKTNLLLQKWAQKAKLMNQGLQNIYGAGSTAAYLMGGDGSGSSGTTDMGRASSSASDYQISSPNSAINRALYKRFGITQ
jgi:hypothetical protein